GGLPRVKLLDWGIARVMHIDSEMTFEGQLVGTPRYIAPEQARGERVTPQTDVYSLGVVAYEMLLGRPPFDATTPTEMLAMHLLVKPPAPRDMWPTIPPRLERLLQHMLAKAPDARPTMSNVAESLADIRNEIRRQKQVALIIEDDEPEPELDRRRTWPLA